MKRDLELLLNTLEFSYLWEGFLGIFCLTVRGGLKASQVALMVKNSPVKAGDIRDVGLIPGLGRSPGGGHGNLLQYSRLENLVRGAWLVMVHRITASDMTEMT